MSTAVRINNLALSGPGPKTLSSMESHGKRLDATARARRAGDTPPLVHGSLDLAAAFGTHTEGCRMNRAARKPVMHAIVQFPTAIALPADPAAAEPAQRRMLGAAVDFVNRTYGEPDQPAVFAARMDRDEAGRHAVDVFFAPKYWKETKSRGRELWTGTTRHGKALARRHEAEIRRRHSGSFTTGPRQIGIALQSEWRGYLAAIAPELGLPPDGIAPKHEKQHGGPDRLEPEAFKARRDLERAAEARREAEARAAELDRESEESEARASQALHDAEIAAARKERRRRLDLARQLAAVTAEQERLGFHQVVKDLRLSRRADALETELRPLEAAAAATDALAAELTREDRDEKTGNAERAAALDRREEGLDAEAVRRGNRQAAAWAGVVRRAARLISDEIAEPAAAPGEWLEGRRWDRARWTKETRAQPALVRRRWPAGLWETLRDLAARVTEPLRQLAAARAESERLSAELELRPAADEWAALLKENSGLKARIAALEPPEPDDSPSFTP